MKVVGALAVLSLLLVGSWVGTRLLGVARRTRRAPELCVGLGLLLTTLLGYPFAIVGRLPALMRTPLGDLLFAIGLGLTVSGIACIYLFTWRVFRPGVLWARVAIGLAALALASTGVGLVRASSLGQTLAEVMPHTRPWACAIVSLVAVAFAWTAAESLRYHRILRRRLALGLADPAVANRFLLWAVSGIATTLLCVGILGFLLGGVALLRDERALLLIAATGLTASAGWYLAFTPPAAYLRFVRSRAPLPEA